MSKYGIQRIIFYPLFYVLARVPKLSMNILYCIYFNEKYTETFAWPGWTKFLMQCTIIVLFNFLISPDCMYFTSCSMRDSVQFKFLTKSNIRLCIDFFFNVYLKIFTRIVTSKNSDKHGINTFKIERTNAFFACRVSYFFRKTIIHSLVSRDTMRRAESAGNRC